MMLASALCVFLTLQCEGIAAMVCVCEAFGLTALAAPVGNIVLDVDSSPPCVEPTVPSRVYCIS